MLKQFVRRTAAFTLIELLVVIAIISLLVSILLPSLNLAKELAKMAVCASQLRSVGIAEQMYAEEEEGIYPPGGKSGPTGHWWPPDTSGFCGQLAGVANAWALTYDNDALPGSLLTDCPTAQPQHYRIDYARNKAMGIVGDEWYMPMIKADHVTIPADKVSMADARDWNDWTFGGPPVWGVAPPATFTPPHLIWENAIGFFHAGSGNANLLFLDTHVGSHTDSEPEDIWFWPTK